MIFPAPRKSDQPLPRPTAIKWWKRACALAKLPREAGLGWHSVRRQFASELKSAPLRDLAYLGGWKNPQTVLVVYQRPDEETQRQILAGRRGLRSAAGSG